ncbi:c-type cytochrome domain-containing protein, partial [Ochrovirga pacifica]|uniref:c-type cytochrome domain-containing protein n=1 Tax=Ochrovirga pacifica TaxID=1042376 RepID=UPI0002558E90
MKKITEYLVQSLFLLHIFLAFLLIFESHLQVPFWIQPLGRMHPLVLHFPVAFIVLLALMNLIKSSLDKETYKELHYRLLVFTAFTTVVATLMGFLLSLEGYESSLMQLHKWLGIALSFYLYGLVYIYNKKVYVPLLYGGVLMVILVGHFGAGLTHGNSFITEPLQTKEIALENQSIYKIHIQPILDAKCVSCHNTDKPKGGLDMSSIVAINKGGKHGGLWVAHQPEKSLFLERVHLPLEHKKHMAPDGKPQLSKEEIQLLTVWIQQGANDTVHLATLEDANPLKKLISTKWIKKENEPVYEFDYAATETLEQLQGSPYISIQPKSASSPALDATILGGSAYHAENLKSLLAVKEQIVSLNLSNLAVTDADMQLVKEFVNLEKLWLNFTDITSKGLMEIVSLEHLKMLSAAGTALDNESIESFKKIAELATLCVWDTPIDKEKLAAELPTVRLEKGIKESSKKSVLPPPVVKGRANVLNTGDVLHLTHLDPEAIVKYSFNTKVTDSAMVYKKGIPIDFKGKDELVIKARACKKGKQPSKEIAYKLHRKGFIPVSLETKFHN